MKIINSLIKTKNVNKAAAGITCILAISSLAIALIGLIAPTGNSFKAIVQMGSTNHGILLGTSIVVLIVDLFWLKALSKEKKKVLKSASQSSPLPKFSIAVNDQPKLKPDTLPSDLNILVLSYLDPDTLDKCSNVSGWEKFANTPLLWNSFVLRTLSPKLRVFDERDWETSVDLSSFGLDMSDAQPIDKRAVLPELSRLISSVPIEGDRGFTFLTIPKGLTLNKLIRLAGMPKQGHITNFRLLSDRISAEFGDVPVEHTYRIAISNNVLIGSRSTPPRSQDILTEVFRCEMPRLLEATTLIVTTHMYFGERLYSDSPKTYTRCSNRMHDGNYMIVGAFDPLSLWVFCGYFNSVRCGAACVQRNWPSKATT